MRKILTYFAVVLLTMTAAVGATTLVSAWTGTTPEVSVSAFGGPDMDRGRAVATHSSGSVYVAGTFRGTIDLDPGVGTFSSTAISSRNDLYVVKLDRGGQFVWARTLGINVGNEFVLPALATDSSGNIYVTGSFQDATIDFDPGPGVQNLTASAFQRESFVWKLDPSGNLAWVVRTTGSNVTMATSVAIGPAGDVFVAGGFSGTTDFNPGAGTFNLTDTTVNGDSSFVWRLTSAGAFVSAVKFGGGSYDLRYHVTTDGAGNSFVAGPFAGTVDFDPGANTVELVSNGNYDVFVAKFDPSGGFGWVKSFGNSNSENIDGLALDGSGNVHLSGSFSGTVDFDPGASVTNGEAPFGEYAYVARLGTDGSFAWVRTLKYARAQALTVAPSGAVYATGYFSGTTDFDPGQNSNDMVSAGSDDAFVWKLGSSGDLEWSRRAGGPLEDRSFAIAVDDLSGVYVSGDFRDQAEFSSGGSSASLASGGDSDVFLWKAYEVPAATSPPSSVEAPSGEAAPPSSGAGTPSVDSISPAPATSQPTSSTAMSAGVNESRRLSNGVTVTPMKSGKKGRSVKGRSLLSPSPSGSAIRLVSRSTTVCKVSGGSLRLLRSGTCNYVAYVTRLGRTSSIRLTIVVL